MYVLQHEYGITTRTLSAMMLVDIWCRKEKLHTSLERLPGFDKKLESHYCVLCHGRHFGCVICIGCKAWLAK
jgi:hypothetical protein